MKTLSMRLPDALATKLNTLAKKRGEPKSEVAREAIEVFVNGSDVRSELSCHDLGKDLAGCVEGPVDLATNKKHLRGYGR